MTGRAPRFLLTGAPGAGKTTLVRRLVDLIEAQGVVVGGFTTRELREHGERVGFVIEAVNGESAILAHVRGADGPRVGRYRVDVAAFERIALPAMQRAAAGGGVVVIDELGRMELHSDAFVTAVQRLFEQDVPVVATVHARAHPVTDALKQRPGVEVLTVTRDTHQAVLARVTACLLRQGG